MMKSELERLVALCRQGDGDAAAHLYMEARRRNDVRLLELALVGSILCPDKTHPVKGIRTYWFMIMSSPVPRSKDWSKGEYLRSKDWPKGEYLFRRTEDPTT